MIGTENGVDFDDIMKVVNEGYQHSSEHLRGVLGGKYSIDEMALLFGGVAPMFGFIGDAVSRDGYELFNRARDTVHTQPILGHYEAEFWFLGTPYDYRLEVMRYAGVSPLHDSLVHSSAEPELGVFVVHASFKCEDMDDYGNATQTLRRAGWELLQRCDAHYGRYSYWNQPDGPEGVVWYLKPRVNLRDTEKNDA